MKIMNIIKRFITKNKKVSNDRVVNDYYNMTFPCDQNAVDIFKGEWSSRFPEFAGVQAGTIPLFDDERIKWLLSSVDVSNLNLLELGPLEGGHSYMLEKAGAKKITAIEANTKAFLKCLITKEIIGLKRTKFLCGDFVNYLENNNDTYDGVIACGVLYHMSDPVRLIHLISRSAIDFIFIWTHYYDENWVKKNSNKERFSGSIQYKYMDLLVNYHRQNYLLKKSNIVGFCGGGYGFSYWMSRDQIIDTLSYFGFTRHQISFDEYNHPNGPSFAIIARRK